MHEYLGTVDGKALSLANTVVANPPGLMSIAYNPAGLSRLPDGTTISINMLGADFSVDAKFTDDPNHRFIGYETQMDPLAGTEGKNQAGLVYVPGLNTTLKLDYIFAPSAQVAYKPPGSKWTFAAGPYYSFAAGWNFPGEDNPVRYQCKRMYHQHIVAMAPSTSYQLFDNFSIGLSVGLGMTSMGVNMDMRAPSDMLGLIKTLSDITKNMEIPIFSELIPSPWFGNAVGPFDKVANLDVEMNDFFVPTYNIGILWDVFDWLTFGANYQSEVKSRMSGKYTINYSDEWQSMVSWMGATPITQLFSAIFDLPHNSTPTQTGNLFMEFKLPQMAQFGVAVKPFKNLTLMADVNWANWSSVENLEIEFDQDIQVLQFVKMLGFQGGDRKMPLPMMLKDTWNYSFGIEYQALDWLTLRCGYEKRKSSANEEFYSLILPLPDLDFYAGGFGFQFGDGILIDLGFGYLYNNGYNIPDNTSKMMNSTDFTYPIYNPYAGLNVSHTIDIYLTSLTVTMPTETMGNLLDDFVDVVKSPVKWFSPSDKTKNYKKNEESGQESVVGSQQKQINVNLKELEKSIEIEPSKTSQTIAMAAKTGLQKEKKITKKEPNQNLYPYSIYLDEFESKQRADMAILFYKHEGLFPYIVKDNKLNKWIIYTGYFKNEKQAQLKIDNNFHANSKVIDTPYAVSLGNFESKQRANFAILHYPDLKSTIYTIKTKSLEGKYIYRLLVGAFKTKDQAQNMVEDLMNKGVVCKVVTR